MGTSAVVGAADYDSDISCDQKVKRRDRGDKKSTKVCAINQ